MARNFKYGYGRRRRFRKKRYGRGGRSSFGKKRSYAMQRRAVLSVLKVEPAPDIAGRMV